MYTVVCEVEGCSCNEGDKICERGFFSLFIQAVYGIRFASKIGVPYYIDFGSRKYLYSDPDKEDQNFWNYYFHQPLSRISKESKAVPNLNIETYPLRIWDRSHFLQLNKEVVSRLQFKENVLKVLEEKKRTFKRYKVLGVQIRCTDHAVEILPVRLKEILKEIEKKIDRYDKLFVATDDSKVIFLLQKRFGSKLIFNEATRSGNEVAVHMNRETRNRYKLGLEVLVDCYCLSLCKHAILLQSNISYAALLFNPLLSFTLLERAKVRRKRLKTLFLFYLNKFGIRKW